MSVPKIGKEKTLHLQTTQPRKGPPLTDLFIKDRAMQVLTPHLDRQSRISYQYDNSKEYLCGMRFTNNKGWIEYIAYWDVNPALAINVFDLCKVWGPIADNYKAYPNTTMETVVGCTSSKETCRPWRMYVDRQQAVYLSSMGLSLQQETYEEITPEWLHRATKPTAPILKPQTPQEWAFKVGTLCTSNTPNPNWNALAEHKGHRWVGKACRPPQVSCWVTTEDLDAYYQLGTTCKWGTPYSQLQCTEGKLHLVGPDCTACVSNEEGSTSEVPLTLLEGYGLKVEITGSKPFLPLVNWNADSPTFNIISQHESKTNTPTAILLLWLLQAENYVSRSINLSMHKILLTEEGLCYYNLYDAGKDFVPPPILLIAYTSITNKDL
jgi:hypothetical protein